MLAARTLKPLPAVYLPPMVNATRVEWLRQKKYLPPGFSAPPVLRKGSARHLENASGGAWRGE